jgi:hypothetical protein
MKLLGIKPLSVVLVGTLLLCHGVFGALHLECIFPECADVAQHPAENTLEHGGAHEHPADHATDSAEYFAVLVVLLGLLLRLLPAVASFRIDVGTSWFLGPWRVPVGSRSPPAPTPHTLQVFRF